MRKRVLVAGLSQETHTFVPGQATLPDFRALFGEELWSALGDLSTLAGALEVARERRWEVIPAVNLDGNAGPLVADAVVETFWEAFEKAAAHALPEGIDGIYLNLHGAMVSQSYPDVEGEILRRIRALDGCATLPIGGVLDLHGNFTAAMAETSNSFLAYRENPHADAKAAAMDGARLLDRLLETGERALTVWAHPPLLLPPTATGTAFEPMRALEAAARAIEARRPAILAVNVFAGFSYADIPDAGLSFSAVTLGDPDAARADLAELSALAMAHRHAADPSGIPLEEALARLAAHREGPIVLVEPADNIGGGAPGDLTTVLGGLLEHRIGRAAVIVNDPQAVQTLRQLRPGQHCRLTIGGRSGALGAVPLELDAELVSTSDGAFTLEDPHSHQATSGRTVEMGPCAVIRSEGVTVLLTSRPTAPFDLAQWRSQGLVPEEFFVIAVKAAVAHRQAYDPIAAATYILNTIGPCASDLRTLPFRALRRPIYPLDPL